MRCCDWAGAGLSKCGDKARPSACMLLKLWAQSLLCRAQAGCCRGAYDGRGNAVVDEAADAEAAVSSLGGYEHGLYAERWEYFVKV